MKVNNVYKSCLVEINTFLSGKFAYYEKNDMIANPCSLLDLSIEDKTNLVKIVVKLRHLVVKAADLKKDVSEPTLEIHLLEAQVTENVNRVLRMIKRFDDTVNYQKKPGSAREIAILILKNSDTPEAADDEEEVTILEHEKAMSIRYNCRVWKQVLNDKDIIVDAVKDFTKAENTNTLMELLPHHDGTGRKSNIPRQLDNANARRLLQIAIDNEWLGSDYLPTISMNKATILASVMAKKLDLSPRWAAFEEMWNIGELSKKYSRVQERDYYADTYKTFDKVLND